MKTRAVAIAAAVALGAGMTGGVAFATIADGADGVLAVPVDERDDAGYSAARTDDGEDGYVSEADLLAVGAADTPEEALRQQRELAQQGFFRVPVYADTDGKQVLGHRTYQYGGSAEDVPAGESER